MPNHERMPELPAVAKKKNGRKAVEKPKPLKVPVEIEEERELSPEEEERVNRIEARITKDRQEEIEENGELTQPRTPDEIKDIAGRWYGIFEIPKMVGLSLAKKYEEDLETLGKGGMANVFKLKHRFIGREEAVKVLQPLEDGREFDLDTIMRFKREAEAMARINHPNVVKVFHGEMTKNGGYLAMELVQGEDLKSYGQKNREEMDFGKFKNIALQICSGLEAAQKENVLHRDIKPTNILIGKDGQVKLADFGLAKLIGGTEVTGQKEPAFLTVSLEQSIPENILEETVIMKKPVLTEEAEEEISENEEPEFAGLEEPKKKSWQQDTIIGKRPTAASEEETNILEPYDEPVSEKTQTKAGAGQTSPVPKNKDISQISGLSSEVTAAGTLVGTPLYMSPEQARGEEPTTASEIYSLGLTALELFAGKIPHQEKKRTIDILNEKQKATPDLKKEMPDGPAWLREMFHDMIETDPKKRPSLQEVMQGFESESWPVSTGR